MRYGLRRCQQLVPSRSQQCSMTSLLWVRITVLVLATAATAAAAVSSTPGGDGALNVGHFVHVAPNTALRRGLADASRCWRKGIRSLLVDNMRVPPGDVKKYGKQGVQFTVFEDVRGFAMPGDYRWAVSPVLGHRAFKETYRWMLFGDDDTVFFPDALVELLRPFDHELPYVITDQFWNTRELDGGMGFIAVRPSRLAPRCLPCHVNTTLINTTTHLAPRRMVQGCPCTPERACRHVQSSKIVALPEMAKVADWSATSCRKQAKFRWHAYGGAGVVFSVGLLKALLPRVQEYMGCLLLQRGDFGDKALTSCLFAMGWAPTDPGPYASGTLRRPMFDPFGYKNARLHPRLLQNRLRRHLEEGRQDAALQPQQQPRRRQHGRLGRQQNDDANGGEDREGPSLLLAKQQQQQQQRWQQQQQQLRLLRETQSASRTTRDSDAILCRMVTWHTKVNVAAEVCRTVALYDAACWGSKTSVEA